MGVFYGMCSDSCKICRLKDRRQQFLKDTTNTVESLPGYPLFKLNRITEGKAFCLFVFIFLYQNFVIFCVPKQFFILNLLLSLSSIMSCVASPHIFSFQYFDLFFLCFKLLLFSKAFSVKSYTHPAHV